jgi:two-component system OmpR family response regulator
MGFGDVWSQMAMANILVVDDSADIREMLGKFLGMAGYTVSYANNGWEALLSIEDARTDLILLDVMMPGMDGRTFLKILRQANKTHHLPVIIITAFSDSDVAKEARAMGVEATLPKTQRLLDELLGTVEGVLKRRSASPLN